MKKNNPHTPILLREALGVEPKVFARYGEPASWPLTRLRLLLLLLLLLLGLGMMSAPAIRSSL